MCVWGGGRGGGTTIFCGVICYHVDGWVDCRREHMYNSMGWYYILLRFMKVLPVVFVIYLIFKDNSSCADHFFHVHEK